MTNVFRDVRALVVAAIGDLVAQGALPQGLDLARVAVEPPRDPAHGDLATNAAMVLAGAVRENPMALAERIGAAMAGRELVTADYRGHGFTVAAAPPGFLNIALMSEVWQAQLRAVLRARFVAVTRSQGSTDPSTRCTAARRRHSSKKAPAVTSSAS